MFGRREEEIWWRQFVIPPSTLEENKQLDEIKIKINIDHHNLEIIHLHFFKDTLL